MLVRTAPGASSKRCCHDAMARYAWYAYYALRRQRRASASQPRRRAAARSAPGEGDAAVARRTVCSSRLQALMRKEQREQRVLAPFTRE